ncbi:conserved hypothetical protein [Trichinella spiralis]|uniref:hypothetical protein n=1 Tax=Trichinella spiralis TaxID=6334 RepID=UPI0001EFE9BA|nr:conserved hypothetical protein [Trichinella spiralis]
MHHTNVGITGTIRRNLQRTTISYKHIQLHMEKKCKGKALEGKWICTGYCIIVPAN